ncbi:response regulator transcription factor [Leptolinea tardivitalis]|uniref:Transcriptional regulator n=1 Tax=Leptolinea tardivitalis TaxID=229920 RepID=A0A0P6XCM2_9CHLR|nr:response regulator transcription factor [Leptolinea tardivitalis]KPL72622.1 transcriptional regulator [Leptolinea tardivitalis]GAP21057.1 response regulator consisting of a CheY-like receiver domain and a winged-helix DNA-binding domain [Leptolinea tardivitalis]
MTDELILLVDDEPNIIQLAKMYLEREGYRIISEADGKSALEAIKTRKPNLVVLDVMLPEMDGLEVCKRLRREKNNIPVIMLTARDDDIDKILGLELGADDYMTKPFNPRELTARVKVILRRSERFGKETSGEMVRVGELVIDPARREVYLGDQPLSLRTQEFEVLWVLAKNRGLVLTREKLLNLAWGFEYFGQTRTVDVHIAQLRSKIEGSGVHIETVTGIGYKLTA